MRRREFIAGLGAGAAWGRDAGDSPPGPQPVARFPETHGCLLPRSILPTGWLFHDINLMPWDSHAAQSLPCLVGFRDRLEAA